MEYFIEGNYPMLKCRLNRGETIKTSAGSMSCMSNGFDPGKVMLQSMPISNLAAKIVPFVPSKG